MPILTPSPDVIARMANTQALGATALGIPEEGVSPWRALAELGTALLPVGAVVRAASTKAGAVARRVLPRADWVTKVEPPSPEYAYHATALDRVWDILSDGRLKPHGPRYGTDQWAWPDGSTVKRSYFATTPHSAASFIPEGKPVLLRTKAQGLRRESTGDLYTTKPVALDALEFLGDDGHWHPVTALKGD